MKKKLLYMIVMALVLCVLFAGCESNGGSVEMGDKVGDYAPSGFYYGPAEEGSATYGKTAASVGDTAGEKKATEGSEAGEKSKDTSVYNQYRSGLITACAWDDNSAYGEWQSLFIQGDDNTQGGKFCSFTENEWKFNTLNRVKVTVKNGDNFVCGAQVAFFGADQKEYKAVTNANGVAYLFPAENDGTIKVKSGEAETEVAFTAQDRDLTADLSTAISKANVIKLMFVIDVTGSMGDELDYLAAELTDVIGRIASNDDQTRIDLAFLFYRDDCDTEKLNYVEFKDVTDPDNLIMQKKALATQCASGGGDLPEALDEALLMAASQDWGEENSTKIIFHVFDAPSHSEEENRIRCGQAAEIAAEKGIRYCPVLCSGADILCEYIGRQGALFTGGTFIYVTDHSGIGGAHYDPNIQQAVVEKLNDMMVRLVIGYHTGAFAAPVAWNAQQQ